MFNLKKCVACQDPINSGLFCDKHEKIVAAALSGATAGRSASDIQKQKAAAAARLAAAKKV